MHSTAGMPEKKVILSPRTAEVSSLLGPFSRAEEGGEWLAVASAYVLSDSVGGKDQEGKRERGRKTEGERGDRGREGEGGRGREEGMPSQLESHTSSSAWLACIRLMVGRLVGLDVDVVQCSFPKCHLDSCDINSSS